MDDLISRKAAIEAMHQHSHYDDFDTLVLDEDTAVIALKELPSAETEAIRCKDCKHRIVNENYGKKGYMNLKAMCELDSGDPFELSRCAEDDDWFCADGERR